MEYILFGFALAGLMGIGLYEFLYHKAKKNYRELILYRYTYFDGEEFGQTTWISTDLRTIQAYYEMEIHAVETKKVYLEKTGDN